jgi:hypothetical protein
MLLATPALAPDDSYLPAALFAVFALLAALGGFWIVASHRSRRAGWVTGGVILVFFALLFVGMKLLLGADGLV